MPKYRLAGNAQSLQQLADGSFNGDTFIGRQRDSISNRVRFGLAVAHRPVSSVESIIRLPEYYETVQARTVERVRGDTKL